MERFDMMEMWEIGCEEMDTFREEKENTDCVDFFEVEGEEWL